MNGGIVFLLMLPVI